MTRVLMFALATLFSVESFAQQKTVLRFSTDRLG